MRAGKGFILSISNDDIDDIIKIMKSLEDSGVLIAGVIKAVKHEIKKKKRRWISWFFVSTLDCFIGATSDFFRGKSY